MNDCRSHPCSIGWCEETMTTYRCHPSEVFLLEGTIDLFARFVNSTILRLLVDLAGRVVSSVPITPLRKAAWDITYNSAEDMVYCSSRNHVYRAHINGSMMEIVKNCVEKQCGQIALDEISQTLYMSSTLNSIITSEKLGHPEPELVFENSSLPRALDIDQQNRFLYWARYQGIDRKSLRHGHSEVKQIVNSSQLTRVSGLSVAHIGDTIRLFFSDKDQRKIFFKDVDASLDSIIDITPEGLSFVFDVQFYDGVVYWAGIRENKQQTGIGLIMDYAEKDTRKDRFVPLEGEVRRIRIRTAHISASVYQQI